MKTFLSNITFQPSTSIKKVLSLLNITAPFTGGKGFGIIVDKHGKCIGTISDGDIRRSLNNYKISDPIKKIYNKKFIYINEGERPNKILRIYEEELKKNNRISTLPVLDKNKKIVDIINYNDFLNEKNSPQFVKAKVPIRISFSGGGTDFSNHINKKKTFVLSSTIDKSIFVSVNKRLDQKILITNKSTKQKYYLDVKKINKNNLISNIIKLLKPNFGFEMFIDSDFDPGTGLGGSSALTLAIIACIKRLQNERVTDYYNLINSAYKFERMASKISGGWQDYYSCLMGGFNWIEMDQDDNLVSALKLSDNTVLDLESNMLLFRFGKKRSSAIIQNKNLIYLKKNKKKINVIYNLFKKNSLSMKKSLLQNNISKFSELLDVSWELKKKVTPYSSNNKFNKIYENLKKIGIKGGKILGAGQSGYFLVYVEPKYQIKTTEFLKKKNIIETKFNFTQKGMQIWEG
jgi:D-glycero-alpha-D-manno-heptose-7-phosphate kinase